ncbi:MAG: ThuA domain-containing protein [Verrucomicrobiota bacterium]
MKKHTSWHFRQLTWWCVLFCLTAFSTWAQTPKRLLIVTATRGFRHPSIPTAEKVLADIGQKSGVFTVDYVRGGADGKDDKDVIAKMSLESLKNYDGVVFANTTGILPVPDKEGFLNWIKSGKAFIGMHSASDTFHGKDVIDPFIECLGGEFKGHGAQVGVECLNQDLNHPATKHFGESFCLEKEEIYLFKNYEPRRVHELLILDKHPNEKKTLGRFPVSWCKKYGDGNVFYTSLGHREDVWENELYKKHILGGIKWALGLEKGDSEPQTK